MQNMQESANLALVGEDGMVGKRTVVGSRLGKRADRARYWPAILLSMIVVPMIVVLGFYATIPAQSAGPTAVDLGTAANYVILTKAGMTATGATHIWGDIATSPAAASDITGFDLIYTPLATYSTSALVTGSVYASDYGTPTPSDLSTAVLDMEAAYNSAAGLPSPDFVNEGAGDIAGMTLAPGLYNWTTGVQVSTGSVTIAGAASDVWIFQMTGDLTLASGTQVILSGALASNIFWQVAGQVTLETTSVMKGIILCKTAIVMNNGATLEGSALAQTAVTMDANYVYTPGTTPIPEFSQVLIPLVGMVFVVAIVSKVRNQRK